jgi:hypothetical protein
VTLFDAYVIVDWSANSVPKTGKDSIWIASAETACGRPLQVTTCNPRTRADATEALRKVLNWHVGRQHAALVGFDFPYGYPAGFATAVNAVGNCMPPWRATWERLDREVSDQQDNSNNRFAVAARFNAAAGLEAGPFWACPKSQSGERLHTKGHDWKRVPLRRYRHTERRLRSRKQFVQETWKLYGNGAVGSQALLGIPRVRALRRTPELEACSAVWPFETGFCATPTGGQRPFVLHAEIWPGIASIGDLMGRVKDDMQVETLACHFAELDENRELGRLFDRPAGLGDRDIEECVAEEGWILGA